MPRVKKSLSEAVSKEIKSKFDLSSFKEKKGLKQNVKLLRVLLDHNLKKHIQEILDLEFQAQSALQMLLMIKKVEL